MSDVETRAARALFAAHADSYDRVNTAISLGLDARWRAWTARAAVTSPGARVLDAFAGTGLVGLDAARLGARVTLADASEEMLRRARENARRRGDEARFVVTDLAEGPLPFEPASFDAVTLSFGLRYLDDPRSVLERLRPLLTPDGRLVVLEFVTPPPGLVPSAASVYFTRVLPRVAAALSGRRDLYDYLVSSVQRIGPAEALAATAEAAGFRVASHRRMGFGLVAGLVCVPRA